MAYGQESVWWGYSDSQGRKWKFSAPVLLRDAEELARWRGQFPDRRLLEGAAFNVDPTAARPFFPAPTLQVDFSPEVMMPAEIPPRDIGAPSPNPPTVIWTPPPDPVESLTPAFVPVPDRVGAPEPDPPTRTRAERSSALQGANTDWTFYTDDQLKLLCYRYGDGGACQEIARRAGEQSTNTETNLSPKPQMAVETNSDGTSAAPNPAPTQPATGWDWFAQNREEVLGFVGAVAKTFIPEGSTAPPPTAEGKRTDDKGPLWWQTVPQWTWLILVGVMVVVVAKRK